jgi:hypothetical protein
MMSKEQRILNRMVEAINRYCDLLEEFHKIMDERDYEYTEEQLEKLESLRDLADTIYDNMSIIKDHQDIIVKTSEDIKNAIGYEEEKSYLYIVDGCDKENFTKDYKLCRTLEKKFIEDGVNAMVVISGMLEDIIKSIEDKNEKAADFFKNLIKEREEKHITHDQLIEMVNN